MTTLLNGTAYGIISFLESYTQNFVDYSEHFISYRKDDDYVCSDEAMESAKEELRFEMECELKKFGFITVGSGYYRCVFEHPAAPGVVFKLAYVSYGLGQGYTEFITYSSATDIERTFIAETFYGSEFICVMEKVEGENRPTGYYPSPYELFGERNSCYYDDHYGNFIRNSKGKVIMIDYA